MSKTILEMERKFKINNPDKLREYTNNIIGRYELKQYYLYIDNNFEKRIRSKKDLDNRKVKYKYTEKEGKGDTRKEKEKTISKSDFLKYLSEILKKNLKPIVKIRTVYRIDKYIVEVDQYINQEYLLNKLVVCEVEFDNKNKMDNFIPLDFMSEEITKNSKYKNASLFKKINNIKNY